MRTLLTFGRYRGDYWSGGSFRGGAHRFIRADTMGRCHSLILQSLGQNPYAGTLSTKISTAA